MVLYENARDFWQQCLQLVLSGEADQYVENIATLFSEDTKAGIHTTAPADAAVLASAEETENTLKVFVGDVNRAPKGYIQQRTGYIAELASTETDGGVEAVVGFTDYCAIDTVIDWASDYDIDIDRVYMWPKGETGSLSIGVKNGDIQESLAAFKSEAEENIMDEQSAKDYQRFLNGEFEVFAVTVCAPVETLEALSAETNCVSYVDVMYNEGVETYAARTNKTVAYVELPAKPDGAL